MSLFPPAPPHNFTITYSVVLPHPPSEVFPVLGAGSNLETVARLSSATTDFVLGETVRIPVPAGGGGVASSRDNQLAELLVITTTEEEEGGDGGAKRTSFQLVETITFALGLFTSRVEIVGCYTESPEQDCIVYESHVPKQNIWIHKLRQFKAHPDGGTLVEERIQGSCPGYLKWLCEREARVTHKAHMDNYHKLFTT